MKLVKISPKFQITIPKIFQSLCGSGWFSCTVEDKTIVLRPITIHPVKTDQEILDELLRNAHNGGILSN